LQTEGVVGVLDVQGASSLEGAFRFIVKETSDLSNANGHVNSFG
jgi:hypothetical protein